MLSFHMFVATPPRRALTSFPGPNPTPRPPTRNSHGINLFADPHPLTPVASIFYKNIGGRGRLQLTPLGTPKFPSRIPFSFQPLGRCPSRNSFLLITIHFHGGWGTPYSSEPRSPISYPLSPLFSYSCALSCTFLHSCKTQLICFQAVSHSLRKTPGVGRGPTHLEQSNTLRQETSSPTLHFSYNPPGCG